MRNTPVVGGTVECQRAVLCRDKRLLFGKGVDHEVEPFDVRQHSADIDKADAVCVEGMLGLRLRVNAVWRDEKLITHHALALFRVCQALDAQSVVAEGAKQQQVGGCLFQPALLLGAAPQTAVGDDDIGNPLPSQLLGEREIAGNVDFVKNCQIGAAVGRGQRVKRIRRELAQTRLLNRLFEVPQRRVGDPLLRRDMLRHGDADAAASVAAERANM